MRQNANKFNASRARYGDHVYHSRLEARVAARLDLLQKARANPAVKIERQVPAVFYVNGVKVATWKVDFRVTYKDGTVEWVEAKGFETGEYRIKKKLFEALYPAETLRVVRA